jgi:hypothetical protein
MADGQPMVISNSGEALKAHLKLWRIKGPANQTKALESHSVTREMPFQTLVQDVSLTWTFSPVFCSRRAMDQKTSQCHTTPFLSTK